MEAIKTLASFHVTLARVLAIHTFTYKESDIYANRFNRCFSNVAYLAKLICYNNKIHETFCNHV